MLDKPGKYEGSLADPALLVLAMAMTVVRVQHTKPAAAAHAPETAPPRHVVLKDVIARAVFPARTIFVATVSRNAYTGRGCRNLFFPLIERSIDDGAPDHTVGVVETVTTVVTLRVVSSP